MNSRNEYNSYGGDDYSYAYIVAHLEYFGPKP
jgi:hypothetical protein